VISSAAWPARKPHLDRHARPFGPGTGAGHQPAEEGILLALHLVDLADRGSVGGQRPLDRERDELRPGERRELDRLLERPVGWNRLRAAASSRPSR